MPTNRTKRMRRRSSIPEAMELVFMTGDAPDDADGLLDMWDDPVVYETWDRVKDRKYKAAWEVFEGNGQIVRFKEYPWLSRRNYEKWKAKMTTTPER